MTNAAIGMAILFGVMLALSLAWTRYQGAVESAARVGGHSGCSASVTGLADAR